MRKHIVILLLSSALFSLDFFFSQVADNTAQADDIRLMSMQAVSMPLRPKPLMQPVLTSTSPATSFSIPGLGLVCLIAAECQDSCRVMVILKGVLPKTRDHSEPGASV